jgi:hypothetical protein
MRLPTINHHQPKNPNSLSTSLKYAHSTPALNTDVLSLMINLKKNNFSFGFNTNSWYFREIIK